MNVREMIDALGQYDGDLDVVWIIPGEEGIGEAEDIYRLTLIDHRPGNTWPRVDPTAPPVIAVNS